MKQSKGFTLIEVTLAIVIGVIVISGATMLYNQARSAAFNGTAQSKVAAAQAAVEELSAQNGGAYPTAAQLGTYWALKRPDDFNKSPWGGAVGTGDASASNGILWVAYPTTNRAADAADNLSHAGLISYGIAATNATGSATDLMTAMNKSFQGYCVWIENEKGRGANFVMGPR